MNIIKNTFLLIAITSLLTYSCTKEEKGMEASVTGFVNLIDEQGMPQFDCTGVLVKTNDNSVSATTDAWGKFTFPSLKIGNTYNILYSKEGYGATKAFNQEFVSGVKPNLVSTVSLYKIPTCKLISCSLTTDNNTVFFNGTLNQASPSCYVLYLNDSINVSDTHYDHTSARCINYNSTNTILQSYIIKNTLKYPAGTTLYGVAYFYNIYDQGFYDPENNSWTYSSVIKASDIIKLTLL